MPILGIDPGLNTTGYAVLDAALGRPRVREAGIIAGAQRRVTADMAKRLRTLYDAIGEVMDQYKPTVVGVEQLFSHYNHPRTALLMAHARGVLLLAAGVRNIPVVSHPAARVKKLITGHGRAGKEQMQHAILRELQLDRLPEPHDVADALAIALCQYYVMQPGYAHRQGA